MLVNWIRQNRIVLSLCCFVFFISVEYLVYINPHLQVPDNFGYVLEDCGGVSCWRNVFRPSYITFKEPMRASNLLCFLNSIAMICGILLFPYP